MDVLGWIGVVFGYILNFFYSMTNNYAVAILFFTILTRLLMFPLTIGQHKTSAKMARLAPKQQEIRKKYANNPQKQSEEMQKLMQKEGVSQIGGCLPIAIQMPIMVGLFSSIRNPLQHILHLSTETINKIISVGGVKADDTYAQINVLNVISQGSVNAADINAIEPGLYNTLENFAGSFRFGINLLPVPSVAENLFPIIIIPILVFISQFASMWLTQKITKQQQQPGCNPMVMGVVFSLMSLWFSYFVPGALGFYWIASSLMGPIQSYIVNKFYSAGILNAKSEAQKLARMKLNEAAVIANAGEITLHPNYDYDKQAEKKENDVKQTGSKKNRKNSGNNKGSGYQGRKK